MTNTQLWATAPGSTNKVKLDLYPTEPIKLTFSAENLTDLPAINSVYSQTFRMPATGINNQFFKFWFNVNINDFDVSKKVQAQIVTEAGFFTEGHIRLQKVYRNNQSTLIDYEVLFLGEVRDFATQVGDGFMNTIDTTSLDHDLNYATIVSSWNASPGTTAGLKSGNVLYPFVEYGYSYDSAGVVDVTMIRPTGTNNFVDNPMSINQFRPWIRARWMVDYIFSLTEYDYESLFFESTLFDQLYINATGNTATASMDDLLVNNQMQVTMPNQQWGTLGGVTQYWEWPIEVFDNGDNWDGVKYTAPVAGTYTFNWDLSGDVTWVNIGGGGSYTWPNVEMNIYYYVNAAPTLLSTHTNGGVDPAVYFLETGTANITLNPGDEVRFGYTVENTLGTPPTLLYNSDTFTNNLTVTAAPKKVNVSTLLPNNVKIIDWFRGLLKKFRLVMVPKKDNAKVFRIEPWADYIGSGTTYDWTHKLDGSKDIQFEPLFFSQSASIKFTDTEDQDHPNYDNQTVFKEVYGTRLFDSNNELLKDQRTIDTLFAPTPVEIIDNYILEQSMIFPHLAKVEASSAGTIQLKPIVAKPRLLFYNGLKNVTGLPVADGAPPGTPANLWNFEGNSQSQYPLASYLSDFPSTPTSLNLNWEIEPGRWPDQANPDGLNGEDVYTRYWQGYIESVYSSEARKMTATFVLDANDLGVDFNDTIFIKDSWWRILKINNAPLTGINPIQVELIKVFDAPDNSCNCTEYYVTDNRPAPTENPFFFTYIDCDTGLPTTGQVDQQSIAVCSCEPFTTGDKLVTVTSTGAACYPPAPPSPVEEQVYKNTDNAGTTVIDKTASTNPSDVNWINIAGVDLPAGEVSTSINVEIEEGYFWRVGYQQTSGTGDIVNFQFIRDNEIIYQEQIDAPPTMRYVICPEPINENYAYSVNVTIS
jgi:hypothetical protein